MDTDTTETQGANPGPKVIRANRFILEDENGKTRAELAMRGDGTPELTLHDKNGAPRIMLFAHDDGPALRLLDDQGKSRLSLGVHNDGPALSLCDKSLKTIVALGVGDGQSWVAFSDEDSTVRSLLGVSKEGPKLNMFDRNGKKVWSQP